MREAARAGDEAAQHGEIVVNAELGGAAPHRYSGQAFTNLSDIEGVLAGTSIVLVAGEALHQRPTLSRRWPALVAFLFGLVHGLGFAGALKEIGLPQHHLPVALLTFNVGVELGQLLVVAVAYPVYRAFAGSPKFAVARTPALYAIGGVAAYWSIGRIVSIVA